MLYLFFNSAIFKLFSITIFSRVIGPILVYIWGDTYKQILSKS